VSPLRAIEITTFLPNKKQNLTVGNEFHSVRTGGQNRPRSSASFERA